MKKLETAQASQLDNLLSAAMMDAELMGPRLVEPLFPSEPFEARILRITLMLRTACLPAWPNAIASFLCCDADFADWGGEDRLIDMYTAAYDARKAGLN